MWANVRARKSSAVQVLSYLHTISPSLIFGHPIPSSHDHTITFRHCSMSDTPLLSPFSFPTCVVAIIHALRDAAPYGLTFGAYKIVSAVMRPDPSTSVSPFAIFHTHSSFSSFTYAFPFQIFYIVRSLPLRCLHLTHFSCLSCQSICHKKRFVSSAVTPVQMCSCPIAYLRVPYQPCTSVLWMLFLITPPLSFHCAAHLHHSNTCKDLLIFISHQFRRTRSDTLHAFTFFITPS